MASNLQGKRIAILATDGFEQSELMEPRKALDAAGAHTEIVAPKDGKIKGWNHTDWGESVKVDKTLDHANASEYDALILPGGVMNPDRLRMEPKAVEFVQSFVASGKTIAAICHGPWTLLETGALKGRTVTSWPSLKTDLQNVGAHWVDKEVVTDRQFITSRKPDDLPAFNRAVIESIAHGPQKAAAA
jgi:protease I